MEFVRDGKDKSNSFEENLNNAFIDYSFSNGVLINAN